MFVRKELYHAVMAHFPIAITMIWIVLECVAVAYKKKRRELDLIFLILAVLGVAFSFLANFTGEMAESVHIASIPQAKEWIRHHAEIGSYIIWFYLCLTVISGILMVVALQWMRVVRFGIAFGLAIIVAITATRGGELVFEHGLGVKGRVEMAETIDAITLNWKDENGVLVREELKKEILTRGSWTTIMFLYRELNRKTSDYGPPKISIRRYRKGAKGYQEQSKFTVTNAKQAYQIMDVFKQWFPEDPRQD